jgi:hypothetical protein
MIKDILQDIVAHTHSLGFLNIIKVTSDATATQLESMADDRSVILIAKTHSPIAEFDSMFGMPNLEKLNLHLKNPEYQENAKIEVVTENRNGLDVPANLHFENATGDFQNDYRFMTAEMVTEKVKSVKFKGSAWDVEFEPSLASITRLKYQAAANSDETTFKVKTENKNLIFIFGDVSTHAGSFVFQSDVNAKLNQDWAWPISSVQSILNLSGDITMKISNQGAMQITVNSGLAEYNYILPALSK